MYQRPLARGLAVSAVSALVITGLTTTPAHAVGPDVSFISQYNPQHRASVRRDSDVTPTVRLAARVDVTDSPTLSFEYNTDPAAGPSTGGWTSTGAMPSTAGDIVTASWMPPGELTGTSIALRIVATTADGTSYAIRNQVPVTGDGSSVNAVEINNASGRFFEQPYASTGHTKTLTGVGGTTSATSGNVELSWWRASDGTFQGQTDAAVEPQQLKVSIPSTYIDGGGFSGVLDITGFGADTGDYIAIGARRDSDDVIAVQLNEQTIGSISSSVPSDAPGRSTPVMLQVRDTGMNGVPGAEVRRKSDSALLGYTDAQGFLDVPQQSGTTSSGYYVNTTDVDAYQAGTDWETGDVMTPAFTPVATATEPVLADGDVFDDDEYAAGDIALQVVDQEGVAFAGAKEVHYALYPTGTTPPAPTTATTNSNGRLTIPFNPAGADGEYTLDYTAPTGAPEQDGSQTFVAGSATISLSPGQGTAAAGGQITFKGRLDIDGAPLAGRKIALTYKRGVELVPGSGADAGMTGVGGALSGTVTTSAKGTFTVTVDDPAESGNPTETGGKLSAATATNVASGDSTLTGNAKENTASTAEFGSGKGGVKVTLKGASKGGAADSLNVVTPKSVKGEKVTIFRKVGKGKWTAVVTKALGTSGVKLKVKDPNGAKVVLYRATIVASDRVKSTTSKILKLK